MRYQFRKCHVRNDCFVSFHVSESIVASFFVGNTISHMQFSVCRFDDPKTKSMRVASTFGKAVLAGQLMPGRQLATRIRNVCLIAVFVSCGISANNVMSYRVTTGKV